MPQRKDAQCIYSYLEKGCRGKKVLAIIPKGIVGGFEFAVFKGICKNGFRAYGRMFASAKGKQQK